MYELRKEEIEIARTSDEVYSWVFSTLEKFNTNEGRVAIRSLTTNYIKVLIEESYPIAIFMKHYYHDSTSVKITQIVGSQNYDAIIKNNTGTPQIEFLEVTQAVDGKLEKFRMLELIENGHVTGGKVFYNKSLPKGKRVSFSKIAESPSVIKEEIKETIKACVISKASKQYQLRTALLIAFDDRRFHGCKEIESLNKFAKTELVPLIDNFVLLAIVGINKETVLTYSV